MMKNKKGDSFMLKYVISIVIGIIALLLLFKTAGLAYSLISGGNNKEKAVNQLGDLIKNINESEIEKDLNYTILIPKGWYLTSYSKDSLGLPNECTGKNCLCICPAKRLIGTIRTGVNCDAGVCKIIEKEAKMEEEIKIPADILLRTNGFYNISKKEGAKE